ncbi:MAG TPA: glycosyltransferase [Actinoplanes sp.]|nr:glycosyltransferase [Actinoplanes sp.]
MTVASTGVLLPDVTVVIPVRNAARLLPECLASVSREGPGQVVVVDGNSTDGTLDVARRYPTVILSDEGRGLPVARMLGVQAAETRYVVLVDADVVLPEGSLARLLEEFVAGGYTALQAGLHSVGGPGYWGRALAEHHRSGRSKNWFGLVATVFERKTLLDVGFDERFVSGEDIELRWRLAQGDRRIGVSRTTVVTHRFAGDTFRFARDQFAMDGRGLAEMVRKHRWRGVRLLALPGAAAARGVLLSLARLQPQWLPYYLCFAVGNYAAMIEAFTRRPRGAGS